MRNKHFFNAQTYRGLLLAILVIGLLISFAFFSEPITRGAPAPGRGPSAVTNPVIDVFSVLPTSAQAGGPAFILTVNGANFPNEIVLRWNGSDRITTRISSSQLLADITAADIQSPGTAAITFAFAGGETTAINFAITCPCGYEGDVSTRPFGNDISSASDWTQIGRFVSGVDMPTAGCEFQRADTAPIATLGDGILTVADWAQSGRYTAGLDARVCAGGPTGPTGEQVDRFGQ
jgi:hypothetical protein